VGIVAVFAAGCDEAQSKFDAAQKDEQFQFGDGALRKYFDIVQNHRDSAFAAKAQERLYELVKQRTKDFTTSDEKSREVMEFFSKSLTSSKLGKVSAELAAKAKFKEELVGKFTKFLEKMTIEDYGDLAGYFTGGKVIEDLVDKLARRESRGGMIVQGFRFVDFVVEGPDRAGMIIARQEYYPENGTTGEIKYRLHCAKESVGWVITSMAIIR
jgi:hypothetical protein